ncbi:MAG: hypothetical protein C4570_02070 [Ammonifex sp.]|jgi:hypothetical protein|nr:MAG: hypothetical protein C4570_02070 [Ammonifex sp.]
MANETKTLAVYLKTPKKAADVVRDAYNLSRQLGQKRRDTWTEIYLAYHGYIREKLKKPKRANFHIHKIFPQIEMEAARYTTGLFTHRPFVSVTPSNASTFELARNRETVIQYYLEHCPSWYLSNLRLLKYTLLYGCAFRVHSWRTISREVRKIRPVDIWGQKTNLTYREDVKEMIYDGPWFETYSPTEVFPHPFGLTLDQKPWVVVEEFSPAEDLLLFAEGGAYDVARVKHIPLNMSGQNDIQYMLRGQELGYEKIEPQEDIVRLQHYFSKERFITLANDEVVIRDIKNPYLHGEIPVTMGVKTLDPDAFWPIGAAKPILPAQKFNNLVFDTSADSALMSGWPIWKYKSNIDKNYLISVPNQRIPVEAMDDVDVVKLPEMKQDLLQLKAMIEANIEECTGYFGPQKGFSGQRHTATSDTIFAQQGDVRIQYDVMTYEKLTLLPEAKKLAAMIEQFMPEELQLYMTGPGAGVMQKLTQDDIRGEFHYRVSGISESIRRAGNKQALVELVQIAQGAQQFVRLFNGMIAPVPLLDNFYAFEQLFRTLDREDAEKFVIRPEVFGMPLNTDQLSPVPMPGFPGSENLNQHPLTGALSNKPWETLSEEEPQIGRRPQNPQMAARGGNA